MNSLRVWLLLLMVAGALVACSDESVGFDASAIEDEVLLRWELEDAALEAGIETQARAQRAKYESKFKLEHIHLNNISLSPEAQTRIRLKVRLTQGHMQAYLGCDEPVQMNVQKVKKGVNVLGELHLRKVSKIPEDCPKGMMKDIRNALAQANAYAREELTKDRPADGLIAGDRVLTLYVLDADFERTQGLTFVRRLKNRPDNASQATGGGTDGGSGEGGSDEGVVLDGDICPMSDGSPNCGGGLLHICDVLPDAPECQDLITDGGSGESGSGGSDEGVVLDGDICEWQPHTPGCNGALIVDGEPCIEPPGVHGCGGVIDICNIHPDTPGCEDAVTLDGVPCTTPYGPNGCSDGGVTIHVCDVHPDSPECQDLITDGGSGESGSGGSDEGVVLDGDICEWYPDTPGCDDFEVQDGDICEWQPDTPGCGGIVVDGGSGESGSGGYDGGVVLDGDICEWQPDTPGCDGAVGADGDICEWQPNTPGCNDSEITFLCDVYPDEPVCTAFEAVELDGEGYGSTMEEEPVILDGEGYALPVDTAGGHGSLPPEILKSATSGDLANLKKIAQLQDPAKITELLNDVDPEAISALVESISNNASAESAAEPTVSRSRYAPMPVELEHLESFIDPDALFEFLGHLLTIDPMQIFELLHAGLVDPAVIEETLMQIFSMF